MDIEIDGKVEKAHCSTTNRIGNINERAIMLTVHQYKITDRKEHLKSTNYEFVKKTLEEVISKGLETWMLDMKFEIDGVSLISCKNTTYDDIKD